MADATEKPRLVQVAEHFQRHGVEFLVIGGQAAALLGSPLPTYDIDLCYRRTTENLQRLAAALKELHPTLRGAPPDLPFRLDAESLALGANFTFNTDYGPLDMLGWVEPFGIYESLFPRAVPILGGPVTLPMIALEDLIAIKRQVGRPKDKTALERLEALPRLRGGQ
jgi:predicted nucleotidyltransferase